MCRNCSFVAVVKAVINFSTVFEKEHGISLLAAQMLVIVGAMVSSDFLTGTSSQTYQRNIWAVIFLLRDPTILNIIEVIDGKEKGAWTLGISLLEDRTLV